MVATWRMVQTDFFVQTTGNVDALLVRRAALAVVELARDDGVVQHIFPDGQTQASMWTPGINWRTASACFTFAVLQYPARCSPACNRRVARELCPSSTRVIARPLPRQGASSFPRRHAGRVSKAGLSLLPRGEASSGGGPRLSQSQPNEPSQAFDADPRSGPGNSATLGITICTTSQFQHELDLLSPLTVPDIQESQDDQAIEMLGDQPLAIVPEFTVPSSEETILSNMQKYIRILATAPMPCQQHRTGNPT